MSQSCSCLLQILPLKEQKPFTKATPRLMLPATGTPRCENPCKIRYRVLEQVMLSYIGALQEEE